MVLTVPFRRYGTEPGLSICPFSVLSFDFFACMLSNHDVTMIKPSRRSQPSSSIRATIVVGVVSVVGLSVVALFLLGWLGVLDAFPFRFSRNDAHLIQLWSDGNVADVFDHAEGTLASHPFDPQALTFGGFAGFYLGVDAVDSAARERLLGRSVQMLRTALHVDRAPLTAERYYVLAKAYFHLGDLYMDLSARYMERAIALGYAADDSETYLAVAHAALQQHDQSVYWFDRAIGRAESAARYADANTLRMTAAASYEALGQFDDAERVLRDAIDRLDDEYLMVFARNRLASVLIAMRRHSEAEQLLDQTIEMYPESADAHYYLGVVYNQTQRRVQARDQWRTARRIDPDHTDALLSLATGGS